MNGAEYVIQAAVNAGIDICFSTPLTHCTNFRGT